MVAVMAAATAVAMVAVTVVAMVVVTRADTTKPMSTSGSFVSSSLST